MKHALRLLLVDNYDSFTQNVAHLFGSCGAKIEVVRNDDARLDQAFVRSFDGLVIGPGPGRPRAGGSSLAAIGWACEMQRPVFGVCLGHQAIGEYFGGAIDHAPGLMHGKTSTISHDGSTVFKGLPSPLVATRYHSLCVAETGFPQELRITARSEDGAIQGLAHRTLPIFGVQFHPESVLTTEGRRIAENFLALTSA